MNLTGTMQNEKFLNHVLTLMQTDTSSDAPQDAIKWAKNVFAARATAPKANIIQRVFAVLKMDLRPGDAVFGERSSASVARQMFFEAGDHAIDLRITGSGDAFSIKGQILGGGFSDAELMLVAGNHKTSTIVSDRGEFEFENITKGAYNLIVIASDNEIAIENIQID